MSDITRDYSFGGWLRYSRLEKEITLRQAAEKIGMDPGNLSKLERSELDPPSCMKDVEKICLPLGLDGSRYTLLLSLAYQHHVSKLKMRFS